MRRYSLKWRERRWFWVAERLHCNHKLWDGSVWFHNPPPFSDSPIVLSDWKWQTWSIIYLSPLCYTFSFFLLMCCTSPPAAASRSVSPFPFSLLWSRSGSLPSIKRAADFPCHGCPGEREKEREGERACTWAERTPGQTHFGTARGGCGDDAEPVHVWELVWALLQPWRRERRICKMTNHTYHLGRIVPKSWRLWRVWDREGARG